jgi:hypothetical protein
MSPCKLLKENTLVYIFMHMIRKRKGKEKKKNILATIELKPLPCGGSSDLLFFPILLHDLPTQQSHCNGLCFPWL